MFNQVIEENQSVAQSLIPKPTLPSLPNAPLLSPIRKKSKSELSGKDSQQSAPNVAGAEKVAKGIIRQFYYHTFYPPFYYLTFLLSYFYKYLTVFCRCLRVMMIANVFCCINCVKQTYI